MDYFIGVDIGGTKIHSALISPNMELVKEYKTLTQVNSEKEYIIGQIRHSIYEVWDDNVKAIGIGIPGPTDFKKRKSFPPNIPNLAGVDLTKEFKNIKRPIYLNNDSNCTIIAEQKLGIAKGKSNVIGLNLGTGVGGGIIINNELYKGTNGNAGELGHITIDKDGYLCSCGNHGCLEMYSSGTAILMRTKRHILIRDIETNLIEENLNSEKIFHAAMKGDKLAKKVMSDTGMYLGIGLASLINIFNPDMIVLGGAVANALPSFRKNLLSTIKTRIMLPDKKIKIETAKLKHSGTIGAAILAMEEYNKLNNNSNIENNINKDNINKNNGRKKLLGFI